ncbi:uncharacterized protein L3040_009403 [Drepanopeziza brunnea f. sp. 'multigermtubi']|uniref:Uncharacterized protein n=1 Tax=Marssonina brunnea f. sp. multigermtubi (strain MB_m1) TaxID=1072389 RepID=K1WGE2_MARBU|nr:uncharacterized protein MBM_09906 [Drepanopeziza brunnea f. sp. 'multigermtubi' MB_m1]EKD11936.1 hypothetical protein MBM_09906 [Drepanopeziza brunnea f. sp. 'multigermtubi' MB_m1]KAJ5032811.1 hypothetical protein L3040_009403 [Drepanopeziza brunnea f. sp. 'multigermtubi']
MGEGKSDSLRQSKETCLLVSDLPSPGDCLDSASFWNLPVTEKDAHLRKKKKKSQFWIWLSCRRWEERRTETRSLGSRALLPRESLDDDESKHNLQQARQLGEKAEEVAEVKLDDGSVTVARDKPRPVRESMVFKSDYIVEPESVASALAASNLGLLHLATLPLPVELDATPQTLQVPATISTSKTEELLLAEAARASGEPDFHRHADAIHTTPESNMMKPANLFSPFAAQMPTAEEFKAAEAQFSFPATSSNSIPLQVQWNRGKSRPRI